MTALRHLQVNANLMGTRITHTLPSQIGLMTSLTILKVRERCVLYFSLLPLSSAIVNERLCE
jgi:hypothetical protein